MPRKRAYAFIQKITVLSLCHFSSASREKYYYSVDLKEAGIQPDISISYLNYQVFAVTKD